MDSFAEADDPGIGTTDDLFDDEPQDNEFDSKLLENAQHEQDEPVDSGQTSVEQSDSDEDEDEESSNFTNESVESDVRAQMDSYPKAPRGRGRGVVPSTPPTRGRGRGRGRANTPDIDDATDELVPQEIEIPPTTTVARRGRYGPTDPGGSSRPIVDPMSDQSKSKLRTARLPNKYYESRMDPELRKKLVRNRRAPKPLIDFGATFSEITIAFDKDDSKEKGFHHARRILQEAIGDLPAEDKLPSELWIIGLYKHSIRFAQPVKCDLMKLYAEKFNNEENRPFWFFLHHPPRFEHPLMKISSSALTKSIYSTVEGGVAADLSYGALTSMSRFRYEPRLRWRKRDRCTFRFVNEFFEIQSIELVRGSRPTDDRRLRSVKRKITAELIDRLVILYLWNDGFALFINMKGNLHELHRDFSLSKPQHSMGSFMRQGLNGSERRPLFSTIRIRVFLKAEEGFSAAFARHTAKPKDEDKVPMTEDEFRLNSLDQIRELLKHFCDFFYRNSIRVCLGAVASSKISENRIDTLHYHRFSSFTQNYSLAMLLSINFRLQIQLGMNDRAMSRLRSYTEAEHVDEQLEDIDDRFYRLCIYLYRRSSEYFFLDFAEEIQIGIDEHRKQRDRLRSKQTEIQIRKVREQRGRIPDTPIESFRFDEVTGSTAYIPSVVLTPTTVLVRPLKLCKLNRVLREKLFGGCYRFALVELRDEAQQLLFASVYRALTTQIHKYLTEGFFITHDDLYRYLHHSQSQVKSKQFWFYSAKPNNLSHSDAYVWMGNFDKERIVAKHTARIALCFTSSDATIQIPAEQVTYARDVKKGNYVFSDGVGTISAQLRDKVKEFLKRRYDFGVLQIRYGGSKGTLSVDPRLNNQKYQLVLRDSMNKFTSDHDILEVCKLSAPRCLHLNRQDIVLMESRDVAHTHFFLLQNSNHLWLIRSLFQSGITYEVLQEKILPVFRLREIARTFDLVREPFFISLATTCATNILRELIDRTRIRVSPNSARNMFGIMDEYGVLESGQVFAQYTEKEMPKLDPVESEDEYREPRVVPLEGSVVITKNPCHHPGDLRVFMAVYHPALAHLKDVVVFPQKGNRPHSNEISGSDLDGDEYVVIWLKDLIPTTPNEKAYDYDSQADPPKMDHPITREEIIDVVMKVSEQDCLGTLSNIHLAYADREGITSEICKKLAGDISQEVDAAKTGQHPLSEEQIRELRDGLNSRWPDFMQARGRREYYPSERILGKLYRSARRAVRGWRRASDYCLDSKSIDPDIRHPNEQRFLAEVKYLYRFYRNELLEIISVYRFKDEIDLFSRGDTADAAGGGGRLKKGSLEDSAANEVKSLMTRVEQLFFVQFGSRRKDDEGNTLFLEGKLAKAACLYRYTYERSHRLPLDSNQRIFSLPWIFSGFLIELKRRNRPPETIDRSRTLIGEAFGKYPTTNFFPHYRFEFDDTQYGDVLLTFYPTTKRPIERVEFLRGYFLQVLTDWLFKQGIFGNRCVETDGKPLIPEKIWLETFVHFLTGQFQPDVQLLSSSTIPERTFQRYQNLIAERQSRWTHVEHEIFHHMFQELLRLVRERVQRTQQMIWAYLHEYLILALQSIAIERQLVPRWIHS